MSWTLLIGLAVVLAVVIVITAQRRVELKRMARSQSSRVTARTKGSDRARLQYPHVDLSRCLGCGTCVQACPEEGVLDMIHGQAVVVHGARCVGHGLCAQECPTGAIVVTLGDLDERRDIPALEENLEVPGHPGLFLAGEVTGYALIKTAITHGSAIAGEVARRKNGSTGQEAYDLCIVGAGPAGLACSLEAKARGLSFVTLTQEELGGTVAQYPRRKLVMTQPVELPLHGRLSRPSYEKEELMELWERVAKEHELPIHTGVHFQGLGVVGDGTYEVHASGGNLLARNVCLALGRRGTPRKLGVPGEELSKVAYSLIDAQSYEERRILVVGGGDSAIEAALGLAEQRGNQVTLSYRKHAFFRIKARNEARVNEAFQKGVIKPLFQSEVQSIGRDKVDLVVNGDDGPCSVTLPNDEVFVFAGGTPPFELLQEAGVSFDPADRPEPVPLAEQGTGLFRALVAALVLVLGALTWVFLHREYYELTLAQRLDAPRHGLLRPAGAIGLSFGIGATTLIGLNLAYLLRRNQLLRFRLGSLQAWMTSHVATGILALVLALLHGAMAPQETVGGHALAGLAVLVVTGAIGRYFYSFVPRAANGRELALEEVEARVASLSAEWGRENREFGERAQQAIQGLVRSGHWTGSFPRRLWALLRSQARLRRTMRAIWNRGRAEGIPPDQLRSLLGLARRAQRTALMASHYEDLRGLLASWRYLHRWTALLMVLLLAVHIFTAVRFGRLFE